eukprot:CAMPEP_0198221238 /NCGR_PEP_ID=MMETSP1445-20131203/82803_1 /TAXON_ID=36898 /ORGANISM="Pyramimonas sp., Strain CCMP2087" /LENGTH=293 /DNA_ID=CAMNT_0043899301 /DNA_START=80 /DNA_END=961 /DNA_ORIENTATION=+
MARQKVAAAILLMLVGLTAAQDRPEPIPSPAAQNSTEPIPSSAAQNSTEPAPSPATQESIEPAPSPAVPDGNDDMHAMFRDLLQGMANCMEPVNRTCGRNFVTNLTCIRMDADTGSSCDGRGQMQGGRDHLHDGEHGQELMRGGEEHLRNGEHGQEQMRGMLFTVQTIKTLCATSRECMEAVMGVTPCIQHVHLTLAAAYNRSYNQELKPDEIAQGKRSFNTICGCLDADEVDLTCVQRVSGEAGSGGIKILLDTSFPPSPFDSQGSRAPPPSYLSTAVTAVAGGILALVISI